MMKPKNVCNCSDGCEYHLKLLPDMFELVSPQNVPIRQPENPIYGFVMLDGPSHNPNSGPRYHLMALISPASIDFFTTFTSFVQYKMQQWAETVQSQHSLTTIFQMHPLLEQLLLRP